MIFAIATPLVLLACRDILGIGPSTVGDAATNDASSNGDAGPIVLGCGTVSLVAASPGEVSLIAADGADVFWVSVTDASSGIVFGRVGGQTITLADNQATPRDLRVDSKAVYWNAFDTYNDAQGLPKLNTWVRASHSLGATLDLGVPGLTAGKIAINASDLYFGDWLIPDGGVWRVPLPFDASAPIQVASGVESAYHVAVDTSSVYYDENADDTVGTRISSLPFDGGAPNLLANSEEVDDFVVVGGTVYWAARNTGAVKSNTNLNVGLPAPVSLTADPSGQYLYILSAHDVFDRILRMHLPDGTWDECVQADSLGALVAVPGHVYFGTAIKDASAVYDLALN